MLVLASRARSRAALLAAAVVGLVLLAFVATPAARAATPGTFTQLASSPNYINAVVTDPTTNLIYAQENGNGSSDAGTAFYRYDPVTNAWTTLASAPTDMLDNAGAAYLNGKIYVSYSPPSSGVNVYDIATNSWSTVPSLSGFATGDITSVGGLIYLADGSTFISYNPATGTKRTLASPPIYGFTPWGSLVPYNGKIYGTAGDGEPGFYVYDIASNSWTELTDVPGGSVLGGAIDPVTGTFYTYGNYGGSSWDIYDIATATWTQATYPYANIGDGGLAYVGTPGLQGVYSTVGDNGDSFNFYRYNTVAGADVSVNKTASAKTVVNGSKFVYTLRVTNSGATSATGVTVTDTLPTSVKFVKDSTSAGTCTGKTTVSCDLGSLGAGESATVRITVIAHETGKATNTATVSTTSFNANLATSSSVTVKIVVPKLRLSVKPHKATAGTRTCYSFTGTSGAKKVRGAKVSLAGHSARTSRSGHATLCLSLRKGSYHARISKSGYSSATAAIRVTAAPAFTG